MKVIVASTCVPFIHGGGTLIVDWLAEELVRRGHEVEVLSIPSVSNTRMLPGQMLGLRLIDLSGQSDRLISIRYPAHLIRHDSHVTWFIHHHRPLFDLWDSDYRDITPGPTGVEYRRIIQHADTTSLSSLHQIFTNSRIVAGRIRRFNGLDAEVVYPPIGGDLSRFRCDAYGDYIFFPSRLTSHKRQVLLIEAMAHTRTPVRLVIAGAAESPGYERTLADLVRRLDVADRVELRTTWITEAEKAELLASCLALAYLPLDEDSYGYPSLEAHHARKAVVTASDAGGVLELVADGCNGLVSEPTPEAVAAAFDRLYEDRQLAQRLGEAGLTRMAELGIGWDHTIRRMLA